MKKFIILISIMLLMSSFNVYAAGSIMPSTRNLTITKGSTRTFNIVASNSVGRVDISSSNSSIASINKTSEWLENSTTTITVTGLSAGTASIYVKLSDAATFDEEELSGSYTITINVIEKQIIDESSSTPKLNNSKEPQLSNNTNLKTISIEGFEINKISNTEYNLEVGNYVNNITIVAETEDLKSKIEGIGNKELKSGNNQFEILITSESGTKQTYIVKITRKENYELKDLDAIIPKEDKINIIIEDDTLIDKGMIESIKTNKKEVQLSYTDENGLTLYTWILNGKEIKQTTEFKTNIKVKSDFDNKIKTAINYYSGLLIDFEHNGKVPEGTKIKIYVGNNYKDGDIINIYHYNPEKNTIELIHKGLVVKEGYIEFVIEHCSKYFATQAIISDGPINYFLYISIIQFIVIMFLIYKIYFSKKLIKKGVIESRKVRIKTKN